MAAVTSCENTLYLDWKRDLTSTQEAGFSEINLGTCCGIFFLSVSVRNSGNRSSSIAVSSDFFPPLHHTEAEKLFF